MKKPNASDIAAQAGSTAKPVYTDEMPETEQMLLVALDSQLKKESFFNVPVRAMRLEPTIFKVFEDIVKRCSDAVGYQMPYLYRGVHIIKGSFVQREPFEVEAVWATSRNGQRKQREELKMVELN